METLVIIPPARSIKAKALLLIGLGKEESLSLDVMERVGKVALREASRLGAAGVAFRPSFATREIRRSTRAKSSAVTRGVLLAYDTQKRLEKQGLAGPYDLAEWNAEAGAAYFDITKTGLEAGIAEAQKGIAERTAKPYGAK